MKNVVVVTSSPRKDGNSEILAKSFAQGARDSGHNVKFVAVRDIDLKFCSGCMYCQSHGACVLKDSMNSLYEDFQNADILVFASPVYYYSVSGQLKTFLDRLNPLYPRDYNFKEVYLLTTSAENDESAMDGSVTAIQGWIDCFDGVSLTNVLRAIGVDSKGEIVDTDFPRKAYEMGKAV